jgi:endonuclease-3
VVQVVIGEELPGITTKASSGKGKGNGKVAGPRTARTPTSESASLKKPKAIEQALEKPHHTPARRRETYDAIKEVCSRFTAPVDTMGCDTAE